jgi:hypothetical protein
MVGRLRFEVTAHSTYKVFTESLSVGWMKPHPEVISACDQLDDVIRECEHRGWDVEAKSLVSR